MTIPQAAVDAAKQVLLNEGCLDQEHYPGYRDAVVTAALEAAMPHLRKQIADEIQAEVLARQAVVPSINPQSRAGMERAARLVLGVPPPDYIAARIAEGENG